ncbi:MAG: PIG-L family deacetylase [Nocardioidaceae bacterium]
MTSRPYTVVSFHAHPDDEALLTAGTLAAAAQAGHRVVLVTATAGELGLTSSELATGGRLAGRRIDELRAAAATLGCARVELLGYADSGMRGESSDPDAFARADVATAAGRLADLLHEEQADVLTVYDANGGYGHPDHVQVHRVGTAAARLAGTPVVLEATVDADLLRRVLRAVTRVRRLAGLQPPLGTQSLFTPRAQLTHRVDVTRQLSAKRAALSAHATQRQADGADRTIAWFLRLPRPLFRLVFRSEWFTEQGRAPGGRLEGDIFASLRGARR